MDRFSQPLWGEDNTPKPEQDEIDAYKKERDENEEDRKG